MVKFKTMDYSKQKKSDSNDDSIDINIKVPKNDKIKIGKYNYDHNTITRLAIVKLSQLGYNLSKICKILKVSKWMNYRNFEGKGFRKSNLVMKKSNTYVKK